MKKAIKYLCILGLIFQIGCYASIKEFYVPQATTPSLLKKIYPDIGYDKLWQYCLQATTSAFDDAVIIYKDKDSGIFTVNTFRVLQKKSYIPPVYEYMNVFLQKEKKGIAVYTRVFSIPFFSTSYPLEEIVETQESFYNKLNELIANVKMPQGVSAVKNKKEDEKKN